MFDRFLFLIPLLIGFGLAGASVFTAAYSRWWGERGGQIVTSLLRNFLGIPLWLVGFILAWIQPAPLLFIGGRVTRALGWLLVITGLIPVIWGHVLLGWRTHMPSVRDNLFRLGLYAHIRHPIYAGGIPIFVGLALLKPTSTVVLACGIAIGWLIIQALLEEIDLVQRLPEYREYMERVPRFVPRPGRIRARA
jgi:protein-S-isoprenylcysteine O-methyltransferase Ste14